MVKFLRYNSRHSLYYHPTYDQRGGARALLGWSLNPIGSMYDGRQICLHEPLWLFRLRQRLFSFAGRQRCGRRDDMFGVNRGDAELPDTWDMGPDGNRTCSYCGSIHPDDLMKICRLVLEDERYSVDGTDKSYKVYVRIPGVVNASQGAIKFYKQHAPRDASKEDQELFSAALTLSSERWRQRFSSRQDKQASDG